MTAAALITLRETLEASLMVGIMLACLERLSHEKYKIAVWLGVAVGIAMSIVCAVVFHIAFGGFEGRAEQIYEGVTMLVGAGLITWMILWMLRQRRLIRKHIENQVQAHVARQYVWGLFWLACVSTLREGVETVIFLQAAALHVGTSVGQIVGAVVGIGSAIALSVLLFRGMTKISLRIFFSVSGVLLIIFAAGLVAHGVHELIEAAVLPPLTGPLWDLSNVLDDHSTVGSFLHTLVGYSSDPSLLEIGSYIAYLMGIAALWKWWAARPSH